MSAAKWPVCTRGQSGCSAGRSPSTTDAYASVSLNDIHRHLYAERNAESRGGHATTIDDAAKKMIFDRYRAHVARFRTSCAEPAARRCCRCADRVGAPEAAGRPETERAAGPGGDCGRPDRREDRGSSWNRRLHVEVHVRRIFAKLCARNPAHAVTIGVRQKLLQISDAA